MCLQQMLIVFNFLSALCGQMVEFGNAKRQAEERKPPSFNVFGVTRSGIEPRPPAPRADVLTTVLRRGDDLELAKINCVELVTRNWIWNCSNGADPISDHHSYSQTLV